MSVVFWRSPITGSTNFPQMIHCPISAMLAGPRLCPIAGTAQEHKVSRVHFSYGITGNLKWDTMIDLQIARFKFGETNTATRAMELN